MDVVARKKWRAFMDPYLLNRGNENVGGKGKKREKKRSKRNVLAKVIKSSV